MIGSRSMPKTKRQRRRLGSVLATALFSVACFLVLLEDTQNYGGGGVYRKMMPRQLAIAGDYGSELKEGEALIHSSAGKCEDAACKSPPEGGPIPKTIWMLWDSGFAGGRAPDRVKRTHHSWILYNPTWTVRGINMQEAEKLTGVHREGTRGYLPNEVWESMSVQAKSDYIRISLLHQYGGVWADASLMCNEPLDDWIDLDRDYLFFLRDEQGPDNFRGLYPWYSSWWMAASKGSHAAELIFARVVDYLQHDGKDPDREYFWFHRIVASLWNVDESFAAAVGPAESAMGPHCFLGTRSFVDQHMFKRCGRGTVEHPFSLKDEEEWKESQRIEAAAVQVEVEAEAEAEADQVEAEIEADNEQIEAEEEAESSGMQSPIIAEEKESFEEKVETPVVNEVSDEEEEAQETITDTSVNDEQEEEVQEERGGVESPVADKRD